LAGRPGRTPHATGGTYAIAAHANRTWRQLWSRCGKQQARIQRVLYRALRVSMLSACAEVWARSAESGHRLARKDRRCACMACDPAENRARCA